MQTPIYPVKLFCCYNFGILENKCTTDEFACKNGDCIKKEWRFDGENDCGDEDISDEDYSSKILIF